MIEPDWERRRSHNFLTQIAYSIEREPCEGVAAPINSDIADVSYDFRHIHREIDAVSRGNDVGSFMKKLGFGQLFASTGANRQSLHVDRKREAL